MAQVSDLFSNIAIQFVNEVKQSKHIRTDRLEEILIKHLENNITNLAKAFSLSKCPRKKEFNHDKSTKLMEINELCDLFLQAVDISMKCDCGLHEYLDEILNMFSGTEGVNILFTYVAKLLGAVHNLDTLVTYYQSTDPEFNIVKECPFLLSLVVEQGLLKNVHPKDLALITNFLSNQGFNMNNLIDDLVARGNLDKVTLMTLQFVLHVRDIENCKQNDPNQDKPKKDEPKQYKPKQDNHKQYDPYAVLFCNLCRKYKCAHSVNEKQYWLEHPPSNLKKVHGMVNLKKSITKQQNTLVDNRLTPKNENLPLKGTEGSDPNEGFSFLNNGEYLIEKESLVLG